jgi:hypothetical protein
MRLKKASTAVPQGSLVRAGSLYGLLCDRQAARMFSAGGKSCRKLPYKFTLKPLKIAFTDIIIESRGNKTPWPESASELYPPSDRRLSAKLVPTFRWYRVPRGQRDGSLRPYSRFSWPGCLGEAEYNTCRIWGFHCDDDKECHLLGCGVLWVYYKSTFRTNV